MNDFADDPDGAVFQGLDADSALTVQRILFRLANAQDHVAAQEAADIPYWKPCSDSVIGHRVAASALRAIAGSMPMRPATAAF